MSVADSPEVQEIEAVTSVRFEMITSSGVAPAAFGLKMLKRCNATIVSGIAIAESNKKSKIFARDCFICPL